MNSNSKQRVEWARGIAAVYSSHPGVQAIIIGGSSAQGTAHDHSDIDLGVFWSQVASMKDLNVLRRQVGGRLDRRVENSYRYSPGNPRTEGCIEILEFKPTSTSIRVRLDLEHETVSGTDNVIRNVIDDGDPSLEMQELISVIQTGIVLYGQETVERWQEKTRNYPDELANKMVAMNIIGIGTSLMEQTNYLETKEWFCLYEGLLNIGRRLLLTLMGLNREWAFTDNPNFKGWREYANRFALLPDNFVDRLGHYLQSEAIPGILGFVDLSEDVLELIDAYFPNLDMHGERIMLREVRQRVSN